MTQSVVRRLKQATKIAVISLANIALCSPTFANQQAQRIVAKVEDSAAISNGKELYLQTCASCHGKNLEGAVGFNLKDGEWVHGSKPSEILTNIKQGFATAGMPGFEGVYPEDALENISAYILSKREGFSNLAYKIFHFDDYSSNSFALFDTQAPAKSGVIPNNLAEFGLPEVKIFGIEFSGQFHAPRAIDTVLLYRGADKLALEVSIDGEKVDYVRAHGGIYAWKLKRGQQNLRFRYFTNNASKGKWHNTNLKVFVNTADYQESLFAFSSSAQKQLSASMLEIGPNNEAIVERKRVINIPPFSVSVGLPEKLSYAFNTRTCTIEGIWKDAFLNVGPNVMWRGNDGSVPLGTWGYHSPIYTGPAKTDQAISCNFTHYTRKGAPVFFFNYDGIDYSMSASATDNNDLKISYQVLSEIKKAGFFARLFGAKSTATNVAIKLPESPTTDVATSGGEVVSGSLNIDLANTKEFSVTLSIKEAK